MTTPQGDYMKSPFDHVFSFVPQGHEKALKHALYNAVALFLLMVCVCVGYAVCFILEPFIKPLLWALLCGSVLHPFKHSLATNLQSWIQNLRSSSTPFVFGLAMTPVRVVDKMSDSIGSFIHQYLFLIIAVVITLPTSLALYQYTPRLFVCFIQFIGSYTFSIISWVVGCLSFKLLLGAGIAHGIWLVMSGGHNRRASLISCVLWLAGVCYCAAALLGGASPAWNVASFILTLGIFILGLCTEVFEIHGARQEQGSEASMIDTLKLVLLQEDVPELINVSKDSDETAENKEVQEEVQTIDSAAVETATVLQTPDTVDRPHKSLAFRNPLTPHNLLSGRGSVAYLTSSTPLTFRQRVRMNESILQASLTPPEGLTSNHCLIAVGWACTVMLMWKHMWFMSFLPIPLALYYVKTAGKYFGVWSMLSSHLKHWCLIVQTWCEERQNILLPPSIKGLVKIVGKVNQGVTGALESSINMVATVVVICGLIVFAISTSIFIFVQVYAEGVHVVQVTAEVVNNTVVNNPELLQMLPAGIGDALSQMLDNAYQYGREGISSMVRSMLNTQVDPTKAAQLEQQVLELWDRVYQAWVMSSASAAIETQGSGSTSGPSVSSDAVLSSWESLVARLTSTPELLDFGALTEWMKTNVDTLMSLMETVWSLLKGNISLVFGSVTALMSLLLGGGTAVLNFLLSLVVFFTALFYLLSASGGLYKPVELITNFSPTNGKKFAGAFEAAINGVFTASFKMAVFYGLWTWLIHNLFQVKVVYLPSALAAVLGAVPFLGTYWASFPATLELWLAQGRGLEALALLVCHLLPASIVDTTIYKEIKGGGHPYLTGLAVAGGILCLGVEGAIVGPLLLCCLIVAINMSSRLMRESPGPEDERVQAITLRSLRRTVPRH